MLKPIPTTTTSEIVTPPQPGGTVGVIRLGLRGGINTYSYAKQNPLRYVDPYGLRDLTPGEKSFLRKFFGNCLKVDDIDLHGRTWGDTSRAWSPYGHNIGIPNKYFVDGNPDNELDFSNTYGSSVVVHEALHTQQREQGRSVTLEAIGNQMSGNTYGYPKSPNPTEMLNTFLKGTVEQQGQMFQDYANALLTGGNTDAFTKIASQVCGCGK